MTDSTFLDSKKISIKNILLLMAGIILLLVGGFAVSGSVYLLALIIIGLVETTQKMSSVPSFDDFVFGILFVLFGISLISASFNIFILPALTLFSKRFDERVKKIERRTIFIFFAWNIFLPSFLFLCMLLTCQWGHECVFVP